MYLIDNELIRKSSVFNFVINLFFSLNDGQILLQIGEKFNFLILILSINFLVVKS